MAYVDVLKGCHVTKRRTTMHTGTSEKQGKTYVGGGDKRGRGADSYGEMDVAAPATKKMRLDCTVVRRGWNESEREFKEGFYRLIGDYGVDTLLEWEDEDNVYPSLLHAAVDYQNIGRGGPDKWIVKQLIDMGADVNYRPTRTSRLRITNHTPMETCACALGMNLGIDSHFTKDNRPPYLVKFLDVIAIIRNAGGELALSIACLWDCYRGATEDRLNPDEADITDTMDRLVQDPMFLEAFGLTSFPPARPLE